MLRFAKLLRFSGRREPKMPSASRSEIFEVSRDAFYAAIIDFKAYPQVVEHMKGVRILKRTDEVTRARFTLHYLREVSYVLDLYEDGPRRLSWEFVKGDVFERMEGSWTLKAKGKGKTEVLYEVEVAPKIAAPSFIVKRLVAHNLPKMMHSFYDYALELEEEMG